MFELADTLAADHAEALDSLPRPLPTVCIRSLLAASAADHRYAEARRKSSHTNRVNRANTDRATRLSRTAAIAESRSLDLLAEVR